MKIKEARQTYQAQIQAYQTQKNAIYKKQEALKKQMAETADGEELFADQAAILQLTYDALNDKESQYEDYMKQLNEQWTAIQEMESTKQQGEAAKKAGEDLGKLMEVARRIMKGAQVPSSDERKLMEFDSKLYQMAKSIGAMSKVRKRKEYKSLWEDEEKKDQTDPMEVADNSEAGSGPEIVSAETTLAAAAGGAAAEGGTDL